jgi:transcriptional regulator with XRE-family HTH domain
MEIQERIKTVMQRYQLNAAAFADKLGLQRSNVSHVLTGRNNPSLDFIERILIHFPDVDTNWLIRGEEIEIQPKPVPYLTQEERETAPQHSTKQPEISRSRKTVKWIAFYDDLTFEEFFPNT